jgi:uncharacterized membrane protein YphA (DoxX/SURF4 family)
MASSSNTVELTSARRASGTRFWIMFALRIVLGAIFIYAGCVKLKEPWELFALNITQYNLLPLKAVEFVARTLPWFEVALGAMLLSGFWLRVSATLTSVLLLVFFGLMIRSYALGMKINCGCFGGDELISWKTMLRDGSMLAGSLALTAMAFLRPRKSA